VKLVGVPEVTRGMLSYRRVRGGGAGAGLPVTVVLDNVTWVCIPDPASLMGPSVAPATARVARQRAPLDPRLDPAAVIVNTSADLAAALRNDSVTSIFLGTLDGQVRSAAFSLQLVPGDGRMQDGS
jgi:hypothetical protein